MRCVVRDDQCMNAEREVGPALLVHTESNQVNANEVRSRPQSSSLHITAVQPYHRTLVKVDDAGHQ